MSKSKSNSRKTKSLLLPMAVAGMIAGFTAGCGEEKPAAPAAPAAAKSDAKAGAAAAKSDAKAGAEKAAETVAMAKHACKALNACKGQGGCTTGDAGCKGKNSCKGKGGCATNKDDKKL